MKLITVEGKELNLSDDVFAKEYNEALVHQAVVSYMASGRAGTKAQKSRSDVSGGGTKPWRQKGTGRARAGTSRGPIWRKGGVTFAARPREYKKKLNKKMYRAAMCTIFSELLRSESLVVVDAFSVNEPKTKLVIAELDKLGVDNALLVSNQEEMNLELSVRNVPHCDLINVSLLNPVSLIAHDKVVMTSEAVEKVQEWLS